ncbi:MAG: hypothetical protein MJZ76_08890 [Bacteroidales bacterium]|nr:hypothetical protein [Bacteroidales bacterium]
MKHLFYVHSHITFLVSKQYVFDQGINPDDCLFLCTRNYQLPEKYNKVFTHLVQYPQDIFHCNEVHFFKNGNVVEGYRKAGVIEGFVREYTKEDDFILYTLNTGGHVHSIIVSMSNCKGYYLIEEGTSVYHDLPSSVSQLYKRWKKVLFKLILRPFLPKFFLLKDNIFSSSTKKYLGTIASSENAYRNFPQRHIVVSNPFELISLAIKPESLLSIDGSISMYDFSIEIIKQLFVELKQKFLKDAAVAYKFHPLFFANKSKMEAIRDVLHEIFGEFAIELPSDIVLENVLNTYHCDFYSDWSTVGIYGNKMGCKCYSYALKLSQFSQNKEYENCVHKLPEIIKDSYIFI